MSAISLKVIGCGDAFGSGGQNNTCFYIKSSAIQCLVDCGATSLPALKKHHINIPDLDVIILSHFHGDHFGGLPFLLLDLAINGQEKPLTIVSPPGCEEKLEQLLRLLYPGTPVLEKLQIEFLAYQSWQTIVTPHLMVKAFPVIHTQETLPHGFRLTIENKTISYSGDTEWTDTLLELAADADLFICECNYFQKKVKGHLNYHQILDNLPRLTHKKILLTHFDTEMLNNLQNIDLDYATEGQFIEVG